jgi:hypothetical protein
LFSFAERAVSMLRISTRSLRSLRVRLDRLRRSDYGLGEAASALRTSRVRFTTFALSACRHHFVGSIASLRSAHSPYVANHHIDLVIHLWIVVPHLDLRSRRSIAIASLVIIKCKQENLHKILAHKFALM